MRPTTFSRWMPRLCAPPSFAMCLALALAIGIASCRRRAAPDVPEPESGVVARIDGESITEKTFDRVVERSMSRYTAQGRTLPPQITAHLKESILAQMIDDAIIEQRARKLDIEVDAQTLENKFAEHKSRFRSQEAFDEYLRRSNNTEAALKEDLRHNLLHERVIAELSGAVQVTDVDVDAYYHENLRHFLEPEQMRAWRILLPFSGAADTREQGRLQREATRLLRQLTHQGHDFGALARTHGKGPEAAHDGDMGLLSRGYVPELDAAIDAGLRVGSISAVIRGPQGFEIFRLVEHRKARQKPLSEVGETIRNALTMRHRNERRQEVLRELKSQAHIEVLARFDVLPAAADPNAPSTAP